ncbi:MAG TPA: N-6 DNA methylase [Acidobacteriaceae bacterium]
MAIHLFLQTEEQLKALALGLGARNVQGWSAEEETISTGIVPLGSEECRTFLKQIQGGEDPLGDTFCYLRTAAMRREKGATFTPRALSEAMVQWAFDQGLAPSRIVDPGTGSAEFLRVAANKFPHARLVGIELDPVAAVIARANLAAAGLAGRAEIMCADYRTVDLPKIDGKTLFIGNPPYVRHHQLEAVGKSWLTSEARKLGFGASQLAGLHVHFFLATVLKAAKGDFGIFVTAAEWLDVNYGKLVRELFLANLGGQGITVLEPTSRTFGDAASTAAIAQFTIGSKASKIRMKRTPHITQQGCLTNGQLLHRNRLESEHRWSHLTRKAVDVPQGYIELGELCRVHRGAVTGANRMWIAGKHSADLPESVLFPTVTRAKELFAAGSALADGAHLKDVIDIPADLSIFDLEERKAIDRFMKLAKSAGVDDGYVAKNRRAWWSIGLRNPAPILATYMARRTPAFVRNLIDARHINIAHGLYPRDSMSPMLLDRLAHYLSNKVSLHQGRTYSGGLTKFEPREMERLLVPSPEMLLELAI